MMPTDVSGSRLPVGSSQIRSGGWLTTARAIETRCCSPPESSSGREPVLCESPTRLSTSGTFLRIDRGRLALHLERVGHVLRRRPVRQQLEVLEHAAEVAAQQRHLRVLEAAEVASAHEDPAGGRLELLQQQPDDRRLAGAGRADDEHELALVDHERDTVERGDLRLVDLAHFLEHDHRGAARLPRCICVCRRGLGYGRRGVCELKVVFLHRLER